MSNETIVVIGAGVIGLTTALHIQQHLSKNQSLLVIARDLPQHTSIDYASPWAGAHYRPIPGTSAQLKKEANQARRTYEDFKTLAEDPEAGIKFIEGIEHLEAPPADYLDTEAVKIAYGHLDNFRILDKAELPTGVKWGVKYKTYVVNSPVYCAYLLRKIIFNGGKAREYTLKSLEEAFTLEHNVKTVVNCSGMGFGDSKSFVIRGQTCLVKNPCDLTLTRQKSDGSWSFCIPRPLNGGTVIGGTKQINDWDPNPSMETRNKVLDNAAKWFPFPSGSKREFDVVRDIVGRRPARDGGMRVEAEKMDGGRVLVHAYGAGGRGFELSRGVAEDVGVLMFENGVLRESASL
ncbi:FAD dependent oxidoreductase superfamily [Aspergillus sclerotialis]|uniref:FAD dependent oxidoreductase superfamily n=1 Tax=Aspergillus sclerotialis TaxID=2070753 RepID=A0A3A2ZSM6_9EURO|nr:FAD dependent oxidoreductase superfamily [Aspergillus sclerotialis]